MDFVEIEVEEILSNIFEKNSDAILKIQPKIGHMLTFKADLARCMYGMNLVDGALKHSWVVFLNSKIKSGG